MNSRYTYKAKRKDNGEWVYGSLLFDVNTTDRSFIVEDGVTSYRSTDKFIDEHINTYVEIDKDTICQCTGVKDINGKDIFENDILQVPSFIEENQKAMCIYNEEHSVNNIIGFGLYTYDNYHQRYSNLIHSDEWDEFKIIGNKFDEVEE